MSLRTPLGRVRGLGSAKEGAAHWWAQRMTALALIPLSLWFLVSLLSAVGGGYEGAVAWIGSPFNTVLLVVLLALVFYHAALGLQVVIEDYVHPESVRIAAILATKFVLLILAVASILAVLRIAFGG